MDKVQILEKHLKLMLKRTKQSYVTIEQMRDTPEYEAVLNALTEIETGIVKNNAVLHGVSQRSELLAFAKEMQNIGFNEMDDAEKVVDIYMKANCG